jgi:hypothetical protein
LEFGAFWHLLKASGLAQYWRQSFFHRVGVMSQLKPEKPWHELAERIIKEKDPEKLTEMAQELVKALDSDIKKPQGEKDAESKYPRQSA